MMRLSTNMILYYGGIFDIEKMAQTFEASGYDGVDFNLDLADFRRELDEAYFTEIRETLSRHGLAVIQSHAPFPSNYESAEESEARFAEIVRSFTYAKWLGSGPVVVHPCRAFGVSPEQDYVRNLDFYRRLAPYAEEAGVQIAIENCGASLTRTPDMLLKLLDELDSKVFTVCFDVGHANLTEIAPPDFIRALSGRIGVTHIHDNDGEHDSHTLPFYGKIDWDAVTAAFAEIGYTGDLNYESGNFVKRTPADLRPDASKYMASVGRRLISMIEEKRKR